MTNKQESRFTMYLVVRDYLLANATITATLPTFAGYFTALQNGISQIQTLRQQQESDKTGYTATKESLKETLIQNALEVGRRVAAYATTTNNSVLLNEVDYNESDLRKSPDTILTDRCTLIYNRANTNLAALATFGVTAAVLTALQTAINNYQASITKPQLGIEDRKQATDQIAVVFKTTDGQLKKIDALVEMVKSTQSMFYKQYQDVRKVIVTGKIGYYVVGKIMSKGSGKTLSGATIQISAVNGTEALKGPKNSDFVTRKSSLKGAFRFQTLPEGSYSIVVSKPGFKDGTASIDVTKGEKVEVEVQLEKRA